MSRGNNYNFNVLVGREIVAVDGLEPNSECVAFKCADGSEWRMVHDQDCCEGVNVEEIVGDPADAIGKVINAREETSWSHPEGFVTEGRYLESYTWTFYILQTDKGAITIRWLGQSNGYYSERVDFECTREAAAQEQAP